MRNYFLTLFIFLFSYSFGQLTGIQSLTTAQEEVESEAKWAQESFAQYNQSLEDISLRDQNAKHFRNSDGTYTAIIAAGNLHYWENNKWNTIFHAIEPSANGFQNITNSHKTFYPTLSNGYLRTILPSGETLKDMMGMRMYFETNGQEENSVQILAKSGSVNFNELTYSGVYGNGIDLRLTQNTTKRKLDYVISNLTDIGSIPIGAEYLVFEEKVELPSGWTATLENNQILIKDANQNIKAVYEKPIYKDAPQLDLDGHYHSDEIHGIYSISQSGINLTIKTKVQLTWLTAADRSFPVQIDPTVNLYPNNASWWTGHCDGYHASTDVSADSPLYSSSTFDSDFDDNIYVGRYNTNYPEYGWMKFNLSSLPNSCVTSASLNYRVYYDYSNSSSCLVNARLRHLSNDPVTTSGNTLLNDIRDGNIYAVRDMRCFVTGTGWVNAPLTSNINDIEAAIPIGTFGMGLHTFQGGAHTSCYTGIYGYSSSNRPYLAVTYTPHYQVTFSNPTPVTMCAGQTQNISVTVTNTGCRPWTSGWTLPNTVNFSWWGNWQAGGLAGGQDNNPRLTPFVSLAPGASQVVTFSVTAPSTPGSYTIQTDLVRDAVCWFRNNAAPDCGPGNVNYTFPITVNALPSVNAGADAAFCNPGSTGLNGSATGSSSTQQLFAQNFTGTSSGNIPGGWSRTHSNWGVNNTTNAGGASPELMFNYSPSSTSIFRVSTGLINSSNYTSLSLSFRHFLDHYSGNYTLRVQTSPDGITWTNRWNMINPGANQSGTVNVNLNALDGSSFYLAFVFDGNSYNVDYWYIDDVVISGQFPDPITYLWSPSLGLSSTTIPTPTATPASTTIYTLTATSNGCSNSDQVTVTVNQPSVAPTSITGTTTTCSGTPTTLTLSGGTAGTGATAQWFAGSCGSAVIGTGNSITVSPGSTTTYYVRYTGPCNTTTCASVTVTVNSASTSPTISPIAGTICPNTNVTLTAGGGTAGAGSTINWYSGPNGTGTYLGTGNSIVVAPSVTTTYYARREGTCNTTADASVTVQVKTYVYALNGTSTSNYCTDNSGWHHFYNGNEIIFSVQGNLSAVPPGYPVATIYDNNAYYQTSGTPTSTLCAAGYNPGEEKFEMERSWNLDFGGGTPVGNYNIRFYYLPSEKTAIENAAIIFMTANPECGYTYKYPTPLGFYWFKNTGSNYLAPEFDGTHYTGTTAVTPTGVNYAQWMSIPSFSGGSGAVILVPDPLLDAYLPVELSAFTAICDDNTGSVEVMWNTNSENNSSHFTVERSLDGVNWKEIGVKQAAGNSNTPINYELEDIDGFGYQVIYYRLNQFDLNGASKQYGPTSAQCNNSENKFQLFPNPAGSEVNILMIGDLESTNAQIVFNDMHGKVVKLIDLNDQSNNLVSVDLSDIEPGVYFVQIMDGSFKDQFVKFVKQ